MSEETGNNTNEAAPAPTLDVDSIYERGSTLYIATSANTLAPLIDPRGVKLQAAPGDALFEAVGTPGWCQRMANIQSVQMQHRRIDMDNLQTLRDELSSMRDYIQRLGAALIEKANDHDWCSEYDDFADEWDLPRRSREYEVTMTVTVTAQSEEEAEERVSNNVALSAYHNDDFVVNDPSFDVTQV